MPLDAPAERLSANGSALADDVYELLARAIVDGRLAPGERVRDVEIADLYGISRTPVREAIQRLESQGLLEVAAHRYTRVTTPDESSRAEAVEYIGQLAGVAARLALRRATDAEIVEFAEQLDTVIDAIGVEPAQFTMLLIAVFRSLTIASRNRMLILTLRGAHVPVTRVLSGWIPYPDDPGARAESFRRLREAVIARDGDTAERIIREQHPLA